MCIIVDANRMGGFLMQPYGEGVSPIHKWLNKKNNPSHLVYSTDGSFCREVGQNARQKLASYVQSGRASVIPAKCFENLEKKLLGNSKVQSNDHHILALAQYSGTRILFTGDHDLMRDFRNSELINRPRGKVYSDQCQAKLLDRSACRRR